ncbi:hypothetical protein [Mycolicibacterium diernhoferi]|uniref:hypothetical protein n=1 Tax=Mycolicibacterium diernhoferi TaxID=1801 RepID=UPI0009685777|nr:hypothetical protein [Mycolicibacterium diernhoferi]OJZ65587.1 hypothetical protein BRW64_13710 [Mycolicibacterium diernhoferi]QYL22326.1 hypothetical protein K0O62_25840 [Mycolicibacterium diernhoferi]
MDISARSYFTTGVTFTVAGAIALAPLAIPTEGRTIALPSVSTSTADVRLSAVINPAHVDALITALRSGLAEVTTGLDNITTQTGIGLNNVLTRTQALNTGLWNRLIEAAGPGALGALVAALGSYSEASLALTASSIEGAAGSLLVLPGDVTDIIGSTLIGSLNTALYAITDVVNNPLRLASYTGLLAGVVNIVGDILVAQDPNYSTGLLPGPSGHLGLVGTALNSTLGAVINVVGLGSDGLTGQINLAVDSLSSALDNLAQQSGSGLVTGLVGLIQGLALNPIQIINNTAVVGGLVNIGLPVFAALNPLLTSAADAVVGVQTGLNIALNAIGNDPLDLASYTTALGGLFNGGFDVTSAAIMAGTSLAAAPVNVLAGVTNTTAALITALTTNLTETVAGLLNQVGLGAAAEAALSLGVQINEAVNGVAEFVAGDVLGGIAGLINDANDNLQALNNDARNAINDLLGYTPPLGLQQVQTEAVEEGPGDGVSEDGVSGDGELESTLVDTTLVSGRSAPVLPDEDLAVSDEEEGDGSLDGSGDDATNDDATNEEGPLDGATDDGSLDGAGEDEDDVANVDKDSRDAGSLDDDAANDDGDEGVDTKKAGVKGSGNKNAGKTGAGDNDSGGDSDAGGSDSGSDGDSGNTGGGDSGND